MWKGPFRSLGLATSSSTEARLTCGRHAEALPSTTVWCRRHAWSGLLVSKISAGGRQVSRMVQTFGPLIVSTLPARIAAFLFLAAGIASFAFGVTLTRKGRVGERSRPYIRT